MNTLTKKPPGLAAPAKKTDDYGQIRVKITHLLAESLEIMAKEEHG